MRAREWSVGNSTDEQTREADILAGLRNRSREALTALVQAHGDRLTRAAWLYLRDADAAQDATQETLIAAWDSAGRTTDRTILRSWLLGILINRCRNQIRSAQRRRRREKAVMMLKPELAQTSDQDQRLEALGRALEMLKPDQRELIILRFHENMTVEQTADVLGIPQGTVKSRCHTAIAALRGFMEKKNEF